MPCSDNRNCGPHTITVPDHKMESAFCAAMSYIMQDCSTTSDIDATLNRIKLRSQCDHIYEYYWNHCSSDKERIKKEFQSMSEDEMELLRRMVKEGEL